MSLVWQCGRCGVTDPGTEDQREGPNPPSDWLRIYRPRFVGDGRTVCSETICATCVEHLSDWFDDGGAS